MKLMVLSGASLFGVQPTYASSAADDLQELLLSEMAYTQEQWELQATLTSGFRRGDEAERVDLGLSLELGLTDDLQVEVGIPALFTLRGADAPPVLERIELGLAWTIVETTGFLVTPTVEFMAGRTPELETTIVAHGSLGWAHINVQAGVEFEFEEGTTQSLVGVGLYRAFGPWTPVVEWTADWGDAFETRAGVGFAWRPADDLELILNGVATLSPWLEEVGGVLTLIGEWELSPEQDEESGPVVDLETAEESL